MNDATLTFTVGEMYRLAYEYRDDVASYGLKSVYNVFDFVRRIPYRSDLDSCGRLECLKRPKYGIIEGDCDDKSIVAGAMLTLIGVPWKFVTATNRPDGEMEHVFLQVFYDGAWQPFDATYSTNTIFQVRQFKRYIVWDNPMIYDRSNNVSTLEGIGVVPLAAVGIDLLTKVSAITKALQSIPLIGSLFKGKTQHEVYDTCLAKSQELGTQAAGVYNSLPDNDAKAYFLNLCTTFFNNWIMPDLGHRWNNVIANDYAAIQFTTNWNNPDFRCYYYLGQPVFYFMFLEDIDRLTDSLQAWYTKPVTDRVWTPLNNYIQGKYGVSVTDITKSDVTTGPNPAASAGFSGMGLLLVAGLGVTLLMGRKK